MIRRGILFALFFIFFACAEEEKIFFETDNEVIRNEEINFFEFEKNEETDFSEEENKIIRNEEIKFLEAEKENIPDEFSSLTAEEKIGQLFMLRLPKHATKVDTNVTNLLAEIPAGGFVFFAENIVSAEQVQELSADLQEISNIPLLIAVDEEGGRVSRVGRLFENGITPHAYEIGQCSEDLAYETGKTIARELTNLGINMNFAPVADIWSNPKNEVIGKRAFGNTAETVAPMVEATVRGLHAGGVMSVLKHFPGHGDTYEDSHVQLAVNRHDWESWQKTESLLFASGIKSGADGVMMGHITTPNIKKRAVRAFDFGDISEQETQHLEDVVSFEIKKENDENSAFSEEKKENDKNSAFSEEKKETPATFSNFWIEDVLRGEMGFGGLVITDALEMRALTDNFSCGEIALRAFLAGADILLIPSNAKEAFQTILDAYENEIFSEERLNESLRRIFHAKAKISNDFE